jgi:hypothetical protein
MFQGPVLRNRGLLNSEWKFEFHKRWQISWLADWLLALRERIRSMALVSSENEQRIPLRRVVLETLTAAHLVAKCSAPVSVSPRSYTLSVARLRRELILALSQRMEFGTNFWSDKFLKSPLPANCTNILFTIVFTHFSTKTCSHPRGATICEDIHNVFMRLVNLNSEIYSLTSLCY